MPTRLADTRTIAAAEDVPHMLDELRSLRCERELIVASTEKRVAAITARSEEELRPIDSDLNAACERLKQFILANRHTAFKRRRTIETSDGKCGLRRATRVEIDDKQAALDHILDAGYDECVRITRSLVKPKIREHIEHDDPIPGCRLLVGDIAYCEINKALIKEARAHA